MKWLRKLCAGHHPDPNVPPSTLDEARLARQQSEADFDRIQEQRDDVARVSRLVSQLPQPDRLAELFISSLRKNPHHG